MAKRRIAKELHSLSNLIMRHVENSPIKKSIDEVTGTNGWIIGYLAENSDHDIYQKDLEKEFGITRSTASKVINRMVQKGLVTRHTVSFDARLKKLMLTPQAWTVFERMEEEHTFLETKLVTGFSEEEVETLHTYIERMRSNMAQQ